MSTDTDRARLTNQGDDGAKEQSRHECHCGKSFIRKEHLRRHQATHRLSAHTCHICQRGFSRSDLLKRHVSRHGATSVASSRTVVACDACHASKLKCSGAPPCQLCIKRGIRCTISATRGTTSSKESIETASALISPELTSPDESSSSRSPKDTNEISSHNLTFLRTLSIQPTSQQPRTHGDVQQDANHAQAQLPLEPLSSQEGINILHQAVKSRTILRLEQLIAAPGRFAAWVSARYISYYDHFHPHWPILHRPTSNEQGDPLIITATVVLIGTWLEKPKGTTQLILETHKALVDRIFEQICNDNVPSEGNSWPINLCMAILLNVIFALYTKNQHILSRVRLLCGLFICLLREVRMYSSKTLQYQAGVYFPGTSLLHVLTIHDRPKRIVSYLFKADAYLSLLCGQPPGVHSGELDVTLHHTFAQWNANGVGVFYGRVPKEPLGRTDHKLSALAIGVSESMPTVLLIEDIQMGLCGLLQKVWQHNARCRSETISLPPPAEMSEPLTTDLDNWKNELDKIYISCVAQTDKGSSELPLRAYFGYEDESNPNWRLSVLARVKALVQEATILYHVLSLQVHIYRHPKVAERVLPDISCPRLTEGQEDMDWVDNWRQTKDARKTLAHSVALMRTLEMELLQKSARSRHYLPSPIASLAISMSRSVFRIWSATPAGVCTCNAELEHTDLDLSPEGLYRGPQLENWFENGGPPKVLGSPFCKCAGVAWFGMLESFL